MNRPTIVPLLAALALPACVAELPRSDAAPSTASGETICVSGRLTHEGIECPAFRAEDGTLHTLTGDLGSLQPGDEACICGSPAEMSFCMQGKTLAVQSARGTCPE